MADEAVAAEKKWALESVRGLAAGSVVCWHFLELFTPVNVENRTVTHTDLVHILGWVADTPLRVAWDGSFAVRVFFVLSGFVLSLGFLRSRSVETLRSATVRRLPRLAIPAMASLVLSFALAAGGGYSHRQLNVGGTSTYVRASSDVPSPATAGALVSEAVWVFFRGVPEASYNRSLWTMRYEFNGSLLVFATLALFGSSNRRLAVYVVLACVLVGIGSALLADFVAGMILAEARARTAPRWWKATLGRVPFLLATFGWLLATVPLPEVRSVTLASLLAGLRPLVAAVLLVTGVLSSTTLGVALRFRPLVWFGRLSFSVYLLHLPVCWSVGAGSILILRSWGSSEPVALASAFAAVWVCLLTAAAAFEATVDRGAIQLARRLDRLTFRKPPEADARSSPLGVT